MGLKGGTVPQYFARRLVCMLGLWGHRFKLRAFEELPLMHDERFIVGATVPNTTIWQIVIAHSPHFN